MNKEQAMEDDENYKHDAMLRELKQGRDDYHPQITAEEAQNILKVLSAKYPR